MRNSLSVREKIILFISLLATLFLCLCLGSVNINFADTFQLLLDKISGRQSSFPSAETILFTLRLPRILCVCLVGASLALCGAAMQGLLKNPLADGSTLGVSSGAALGAVTAILSGFRLPALPIAGTMLMAMLFAFASLVLILSLAYGLDRSLSTHTIILIGIVFSMFATAILSLLAVFAGEKLRSITFWTMGSLSGSTYTNALILLGAFIVLGSVLISQHREFDALSLGEEQAAHLGVNVRREKLKTLLSVSALIGICVSVGGSIGFVGLVIPHMTRLLFGNIHKRLLPASACIGAVFLLLADLMARTVLSPLELPLGAVTSLIGTVFFIWLYAKNGKNL